MKNKNTTELLNELRHIQFLLEYYFKAISKDRKELTINEKVVYQNFINELIEKQSTTFKELKTKWFWK